MKKIFSLKISLIFLILFPIFSFAQRGKDGNKIVSAANSIVNEYTRLTVDATIGNTTLSVTNSGLNTNNRFTANLSAGDLIMIIQVQGADIFGTFFTDGFGNSFGQPKDSSWGDIVNYNNCGNYEIAEVFNVPNATSIEISCQLSKDYTTAGNVQVVRIPRYTSLTVNTGSSITCDAWNGSVGGIIAIEVNGPTTLNGNIVADGRGFRGGIIDNQSSFGSDDVSSTSAALGGEKGESIAGWHNDYNLHGGTYCKGAPANGGGGGNMHNAGGGGGGNGGDPLLWKAVGNPSLSTANWANAWNLEWSGLATTTSTGGGKGGYTASGNAGNALTLAPGSAAWGGDTRNKQGGYGGRPLDYSTGKIFFGGGGGAGDGDDNDAGAGGNAGGLIYLMTYGNISGTGTISANGNIGLDADGPAPTFNGLEGNDGAGGGGAGGTIIVANTGTITGINFIANGGIGGDQNLEKGAFHPAIVEAEGPGGGGGGGYINTSTPVTATVAGGVNGTTNSPSLTEFLPNGATSGGTGEIANTVAAYNISLSDTSICSGNTITLNANVTGTLPTGATLGWYDAPFAGNLLNTGNTFTTPILNATTTFYVGTCPGTFREDIVVNVSPSVTVSNAGTNQNICHDTTTLAGNAAIFGNGLWTVISGSGNFTDATNPTTFVNGLGLGNNVFQWTISLPGCTSSQSNVTINYTPLSETAIAGSDQIICDTVATMNATPAVIGIGDWSLISGGGSIANNGNPSTQITSLAAGANVFVWTVTIAGCSFSTDTITINATTPPSIAQSGNDQQVCGFSTTLTATPATSGTGVWTLVLGGGTITNINDPNSTVTSLPLGLNLFQWTISAPGCPSTLDQVAINVSAPISAAVAGSDIQICANSTTLNATAPTSGTGSWSVFTGGATITNINSNTSSVTNLSAGNNTFIWTVSSAGCPSNTDTIVVTSIANIPSISAGLNQTICADSTILNGDVPPVGSGLWTVLSGTGIFTNATLNNTSVNGLSLGSNVFVWTISVAGCPSVSGQVTIDVNPPLAIANAGFDISVCATSTNLNALSPTAGTGSWSVFTGGGAIANASDPLSAITNLSSGNNLIVWTVSGNGCVPNSDTINVISFNPISTISAGVSQTICANNTILNGDVPPSGTGLWTVQSGAATLVNPSLNISLVTGLSIGTNVLVWTITNGNCPAVSDTVSINVLQPINAFAGNDTTICASEFTLNGNLPTGYNGVWTMVSGSGNISNPSSFNSLVTNLTPGNYTLQWTINNSICPSSNDDITITVNPTLAVPNAGADQQTCNNQITLNADIPTVGNGVWTVISGNATITNSTNANTNATLLQEGNTVFQWTVTSGNCASVFDDVTITLNSNLNTADAGTDQYIVIGDSVQLSGSGGTPIGWLPTTNLSCNACANTIASPLQTTTYFYTVTDSLGCTSTDTVTVTVTDDASYFIANSFSPDDNTHNDVLYFHGNGVKEFYLEIYDRWGEKVFSTSDETIGWDGNFKDKSAAAGVYVYKLDITFKNSKTEHVKGDINLFR